MNTAPLAPKVPTMQLQPMKGWFKKSSTRVFLPAWGYQSGEEEDEEAHFFLLHLQVFLFLKPPSLQCPTNSDCGDIARGTSSLLASRAELLTAQTPNTTPHPHIPTSPRLPDCREPCRPWAHRKQRCFKPAGVRFVRADEGTAEIGGQVVH